MFYIHLHQTTGEIQTEFESESFDEVVAEYNLLKSQTDEYTVFDEFLSLSYEDVVFDSYLIPDSDKTG